MTDERANPEERAVEEGGSRFGETAFIGCMYVAVGLAAVALFLMFGQLIFRMFFM